MCLLSITTKLLLFDLLSIIVLFVLVGVVGRVGSSKSVGVGRVVGGVVVGRVGNREEGIRKRGMQ